MQHWLEREWLGTSALRWAIALGAALAVAALLVGMQRVAVARMARLASRTRTRLDDVVVHAIRRTHPLSILCLALAAGSRLLHLSDRADTWIGRGVLVVLAVQAGLWTRHAMRLLLEAPRADGAPAEARTMSAAVAFVVQVVVWSAIVLLVLSNLGVDVSTLIAGLGIGGVAAALAVQNVLGDLFAALSIYVDRPFDLGDFVVVDAFMGTVERIGWRSTQLRSLGGELIVLANSDLARARIRNYQRMRDRRVVLTFGVEYATPTETLARIPAIVREEISAIDKLRFDRSHFSGFGDSALLFETVYYVEDPDMRAHMERQERLLLALHRRFGEEGIGFAFPTRTIHVHHHGGSPAERAALDAAI